MLQIKIYTFGKKTDRWVKDGLKIYQTYLTRDLTLTYCPVKKERFDQTKVVEEPYLICLDSRGVSLTSPKLATLIGDLQRLSGSRFAFAIGDAEGLPPALLDNCYQIISLSSLTLTYQMAQLLLVEQLYRSVQILKQGPYHR